MKHTKTAMNWKLMRIYNSVRAAELARMVQNVDRPAQFRHLRVFVCTRNSRVSVKHKMLVKTPSRALCGVNWIHWCFTTSNTSTSLDNRDVAIRRRQLHPRDQSVAKLKSWKLIRCTDKCRRKESDVCALASQAHGSLGSNSCISFGDSCAALELCNLCTKSARLSASSMISSEKCGMLEAMFAYKCSRLCCRNELCHRHPFCSAASGQPCADSEHDRAFVFVKYFNSIANCEQESLLACCELTRLISSHYNFNVYIIQHSTVIAKKMKVLRDSVLLSKMKNPFHLWEKSVVCSHNLLSTVPLRHENSSFDCTTRPRNVLLFFADAVQWVLVH